jgi:hypothetical protein
MNALFITAANSYVKLNFYRRFHSDFTAVRYSVLSRESGYARNIPITFDGKNLVF